LILTSVGSVNWGLLEFFDVNAVAELGTALGEPIVATVVYGAVAVAGRSPADHMGTTTLPTLSTTDSGSGDD